MVQLPVPTLEMLTVCEKEPVIASVVAGSMLLTTRYKSEAADLLRVRRFCVITPSVV